jgi:hypothetical protein
MEKIKTAGALFFATLFASVALVGAETATVKPNGCEGPVLCSSFPMYGKEQDCCDHRWHIDIGLLYQQPWMYGMTAGMKNYGQPFNQPLGTTGEVEYINTVGSDLDTCFGYTAGVTASLGHLMEHDNWYVGAKFDWLSSSISDKDFSAGNTTYTMGINNVWTNLNTIMIKPEGGVTLPPYYTSLLFNASIDIYQLDVLLSRGSFHSSCFSYEPFAGVKALWYSGSFNTKGYNFSTTATNDFADASDNANWSFDMDAWGVGPMFGFNGEYHITEGLSFFSNSDVAILYGRMNANYTLKYTLVTISNPENYGTIGADYDSNQEYYVPLRSIIGLQLSRYCLDGQHFVAVKLGYDARYVFAKSAPLGAGDIASSGLYLNFIWDF